MSAAAVNMELNLGVFIYLTMSPLFDITYVFLLTLINWNVYLIVCYFVTLFVALEAGRSLTVVLSLSKQ